MQATKITTSKRFSVNRIGIAAVAAGTLALGLVGAAVLDLTPSRSDARPVAVTRSSAPFDQAAHQRFIEWNTQLPTEGAPVRSRAETLFLEQNTMLPTGTVIEARSYGDSAFLEQNTMLPTGTVIEARSYDEIVFLEMNQLPEAAFVAPEMKSGTPS